MREAVAWIVFFGVAVSLLVASYALMAWICRRAGRVLEDELPR